MNTAVIFNFTPNEESLFIIEPVNSPLVFVIGILTYFYSFVSRISLALIINLQQLISKLIFYRFLKLVISFVFHFIKVCFLDYCIL